VRDVPAPVFFRGGGFLKDSGRNRAVRDFYIDDQWPFKPFAVLNGLKSVRSWRRWLAEHPGYMHCEGTMIYCGSQGAGKTLSAVRYLLSLMQAYPAAVVCTNVGLVEFPFNAHLDSSCERGFSYDDVRCESRPIVEYTGLDCLKTLSNGYRGVIYLIDEIHLELNSLESKNIDIDVMVEISQQRKQRKHIIGTSQVYMRLAKPLREQIHDIVLCRCFLKRLQVNKWIDGSTAVEKDGKLEAKVRKSSIFWHTPAMYGAYDTYAKMRRYNQEWQGRKRVDGIYSSDGAVTYRARGKVKS
jgi:hypothetical protein